MAARKPRKTRWHVVPNGSVEAIRSVAVGSLQAALRIDSGVFEECQKRGASILRSTQRCEFAIPPRRRAVRRGCGSWRPPLPCTKPKHGRLESDRSRDSPRCEDPRLRLDAALGDDGFLFLAITPLTDRQR